MVSEETSEFQISSSPVATDKNPLSLALLFYIVTTGAMISACLGSLAGDENVTGISLAVSLIVGGAIGLVLGFLVGSFYLRRYLAAMIGLGIGLLDGIIAGAISLVATENFGNLILICFGGCWLLVVTMLLGSRFHESRN